MPDPNRDLRRLFRLSALLKRKHHIDADIAEIVGRPAEKGHVGEFIASKLFGIELEQSATQRGYDGRFCFGPLAGKTVNIKWYAKREGLLDIGLDRLPDYFLVLTGPAATPASSRGGTRPWVVSEVFIFEAAPLVERLQARGVAVGVATSVRIREWNSARIYPGEGTGPMPVSDGARRLLASFGPPVADKSQPYSTRFFFADRLARPTDVITHLAKGEYHWKRGASAFELAHSWMAADGFPESVKRVLDSCPDYRDAVFIEGFFERQVELKSPGRASQTDLMVLAKLSSGAYAVIAVEGKAEEPFGDEVRLWKIKTSRWEERLSELCGTLNLDDTRVDGFRYQLLHRTASAVYEAERYGCTHALILVHSFSPTDMSFPDFSAFAEELGMPVAKPGGISDTKRCGVVCLRLGWVKDEPR